MSNSRYLCLDGREFLDATSRLKRNLKDKSTKTPHLYLRN